MLPVFRAAVLGLTLFSSTAAEGTYRSTFRDLVAQRRSREYRSRSWWREIIFNVFLLRSGLQPIYAPPHRTNPVGLLSPYRQKKAKQKIAENNKSSPRDTLWNPSTRAGKDRVTPFHLSPDRSGVVVMFSSEFEDPKVRLRRTRVIASIVT